MKISYRSLCGGMLFIASFLNVAVAQQEGSVLAPGWFMHRDAPNALYEHYYHQSINYLNQRKSTVDKINTLAELQAWQTKKKEQIKQAIGDFPKAEALNAKQVGKVNFADFSIEHIVFESRKNFFVSSSLYLPKNLKKPAPAIVYCSGHSETGYRSDTYQHVILNLVKKGFIVLAFDPIGQGERLQYFDPQSKKSKFASPTHEHSYPSIQLLAAGDNMINYMVWDGIRAIDYLVSRSEVDSKRIGVTGRSGGGTQSAYLGVVDDRVKAVAIENYLTNFERLYQNKGPQDAEQNLNSGIKHGIDHADFLIARLPKPTLLLATRNDIFNIQGTRETFSEAERLSKLYGGQAANLSMVEDDAGHASTKNNRLALYAFFQQTLANPGSGEDEAVTIPTEEQLKVSPTGQVNSSYQSSSVFSINKQNADKLKENLRGQASLDFLKSSQGKQQLKDMTGFVSMRPLKSPVYTGRILGKGYYIEKFFSSTDAGYILPYLLIKPEKANGKFILWLAEQGKQDVVGKEDNFVHLVHQGYTIVCPDLIGTGEVGPGSYKGDAFINNVSYNLAYMGLQIGQTTVGLQANDILALADLLKREYAAEAIAAVAQDNSIASLLHAAYFENPFQQVIALGKLTTYQEIVDTEYYDSNVVPSIVPNALKYYDLPLLAKVIDRYSFIPTNQESLKGEYLLKLLQAKSK